MNESTPKAEIVYAILCDDTRREANGKDILIGVYSGSLLVKEFPVKLTLCLWLHVDTAGHGEVKFEIRVLNTSGKSIAGANVSVGVADTGENQGSLTLSGLPLNLDKAGTIKIQWRKPGSRWKTILTKQAMLEKS